MRNGIVKAKRDGMGHMKAVGQRDDAPFKTFWWSNFGQDDRRIQQLPLDVVRRFRLDNNQKIDIGDIPTEGITGKFDVVVGNSYPLNITASTITDLLIEFGEGTHNGEFDTREYRF